MTGADKTVSARNIKKLRRQKKWTQEQLAFVCGVDRSAIVRYERRDRNTAIQNRVITKLCTALDTTADVILGRKEA